MLTVVLAWAVGSVQAQETKETLTLTLDKALEIACLLYTSDAADEL